MQEEIFGPIAPVRSFEREDEAVELANARAHGLAGYVCTSDLARAMRMSGALEVGMLAINRGRVSSAAAPFGGVKGSGFGSSGGPEGVVEYLVTRYVALPEA
jgi:succinate-semialdehyde dehydrogenase/glutarate-semialdehyde dehydrogenase